MMRVSRIWAVMLAAVLAAGTLSACSGDKKQGGESFVRLDNGEPDNNSIVVKVGNEGVKYREILNYSYLLKKQYEGSFGGALWSYPVEESRTVGDEAKEEIVNMVTQLKVICANAEKQEVALTNDEKDIALKQAEELIASATEKEKKKYCLTVQDLSDLYEENLLANKMFYVATDKADTEVSDSEALQVKLQYFVLVTEGSLGNGTEVNLNSEERKKALSRMKKMRDEAAGSNDFFEYARNHTDDDQCEITIGRDSEELPAAVVSAAFDLEEGAVSQVIETDTGYYVLYCVDANDEDATYAKKEEIIEKRQMEMFREEYAKWLGEDEVKISKTFWRMFEL